jgi:DNA-binding LytR/AlgR family response regulator
VKLRALIVDDEAPARTELRELLREHGNVEVVGEAASAREALQLANALAYDVVFCDIEMPGASGVQAAPLVRGRRGRPELVFVTGFPQYAVDAFAVEAFDYLLKPVDPRRLAQVLDRLERTRRRLPPADGEKLPVVSGSETVLLDPEAVVYATAEGDYSRVHTHDRAYLCTRSLRELERILPRGHFFRLHRSSLVNLARITSVGRPAADRISVTLDDERATTLPVARRKAAHLRQRLRL